MEAILIDKIRTKFEVKGRHVVTNHFIRKGYIIADKWLINDFSGFVYNIRIVLGTDYDHLIPMSSKLFGDHLRPSSFLDTQIGVVFSGSVDRMIENLVHLPLKI